MLIGGTVFNRGIIYCFYFVCKVYALFSKKFLRLSCYKMLILVMGVSGCGKTSLGKHLTEKLEVECPGREWKYLDADDFHSTENIAKMSAGIPLNDKDRFPWLQSLHTALNRWNKQGVSVVLACSALKESYRNILFYGTDAFDNEESLHTFKRILIVHLKGDKNIIAQRLSSRKGHFMTEKLLNSQYHELEEPNYACSNVLNLSVENSIETNSKLVKQKHLDLL